MPDEAILCVDDEAIILFALKQVLKDRYAGRFIYETARSAEEALEAIAEFGEEDMRLVLVISDWLMPGMKGDELLRRIRSASPETRTILVTGQADGTVIEGLLRDGVVDGVVAKPWRDSELFAEIDQCVGTG